MSQNKAQKVNGEMIDFINEIEIGKSKPQFSYTQTHETQKSSYTLLLSCKVVVLLQQCCTSTEMPKTTRGVLVYVCCDLPVRCSLVHPPLLCRLKRFGKTKSVNFLKLGVKRLWLIGWVVCLRNLIR